MLQQFQIYFTGNEPENVEFAVFGEDSLLFVNSERSSLVFVYDVKDPTAPVFLQALPAGLEPEGLKAIPARNLLVTASEVDDRGGKVRAGITIYLREESSAQYPTLVSDNDETGNPIPFSALSGLAAAEPYGVTASSRRTKMRKSRRLGGEPPMPSLMENEDGAGPAIEEKPGDILYSIEDSYFKKNRVFTIDTNFAPARITHAMRIMDSLGVLADALGDDNNMTELLLNADNTVNLDPEGISVSQTGGFWLVHEGSGTAGDEARPLVSYNMLFKLDDAAGIERVIFLPEELNDIQLRFGFEGVAEDSDGQHVVVAFQRAWGEDADPRIGIYDTETDTWKFVFYPLGQPESQNGGWVGLSDIASLGMGKFMVIERDDQGGEDAVIKRLFKIDLGEDFAVEEGTTIEKEFYMDLVPLLASYGGAVIEKVEGLAVTSGGNVYINTDNDGVEDNSGEQVLLMVGHYHD